MAHSRSCVWDNIVNDALPRFFCSLSPWSRPHRLPTRFRPLPFDTLRKEGRLCLREGEEDVTGSLPVRFPRFCRPLRRYICEVQSVSSLRGILLLCRGIIVGLSRCHFASHMAVKEPCILPCVCSRYIRRAGHFATTCVSSQPPYPFRLTNVYNGTRKVSPRHTYHDTAIFMRFILSLGGRTWTVYHALDNLYICTY